MAMGQQAIKKIKIKMANPNQDPQLVWLSTDSPSIHDPNIKMTTRNLNEADSSSSSGFLPLTHPPAPWPVLGHIRVSGYIMI